MKILDTDVLSILEGSSHGPRTQRAMERLDACGEEVVTSIVSVEEQLKGWIASIAGKDLMTGQIECYRRLRLQLRNYCKMHIIDFGEAAATRVQELRKAKVRVGTMDLKIAAIALVHQATVVTANMRDFRKVPGLKLEDWNKL